MIEVIVAIVVVSVALLAAAGMFIQSTHATLRSADYTVATALGQETLEKLKAGQSPPSPQVVNLNNLDYTITWQTGQLTAIDSRLSSAEATIAWTERGQDLNISFTTILLSTLSPFPPKK